jgi:hypothetical protein
MIEPHHTLFSESYRSIPSLILTFVFACLPLLLFLFSFFSCSVVVVHHLEEMNTFLDDQISQLDTIGDVVRQHAELSSLLTSTEEKIGSYSLQLHRDVLAQAYVVGWCYSTLDKTESKKWARQLLSALSRQRYVNVEPFTHFISYIFQVHIFQVVLSLPS